MRLLGRLLSTVGVLLMALVLVGYFRPIELSLFIKRAELWTQGERSHDVMVDGYRIHYREMGQGTPLLLVHGLGGNSLDWAPVMKTYAKAGYHVLAPDLLGFGKSQKPDVSYSIEEQTQLVHDFLAVENVPQADVVGWSMGGWISLKLALEHPENVHRLVVNDSAGLNFLPDYGQTLFTPESEDAVNTLLGRLEPKSKPVPRFIARDMTRRVKTETGWVIRRAVASMYSKADLLDGKLGAINQPVLIVWGADDGLIPVTSGYEMAREMPQADMQVFRNCGHMAPEICSTAVSQKTLQFLKAEDPPKGLIQQTSVVIPYWFPH